MVSSNLRIASICWLSLFCFLHPSAHGQVKSATVLLEGKVLIVRDGVIDAYVANDVIWFASTAELESITFKSVLGGRVSEGRRIQEIIEKLPVTVIGACASACAELAIVGKSITLRKRERGASYLAFHGQFNSSTKEWLPESLQKVEFLAKRFSWLSVELATKAYSMKSWSNAGLILYSNASSDSYMIKLCDPIPENCESFPERPSGDSGVYVVAED